MNPSILPKPEEFKQCTPVQLRFNDIDILGHVNNTVYFSLYDLAKARYMEKVKNNEMNWRKVETVIANIDCAFIRPILFGEEIVIYTRCEEIREKSFRLLQMMMNKNTGEVKSLCESIMVCFNPVTLESAEVPDHWREDLRNFEGKDFKFDTK